MRGTYVICEGSDKRQAIKTLEEQPEGWLQLTLVRSQGAEPEVLDFASFDALSDWAKRQQPLHTLDRVQAGVRRAS